MTVIGAYEHIEGRGTTTSDTPPRDKLQVESIYLCMRNDVRAESMGIDEYAKQRKTRSPSAPHHTREKKR